MLPLRHNLTLNEVNDIVFVGEFASWLFGLLAIAVLAALKSLHYDQKMIDCDYNRYSEALFDLYGHALSGSMMVTFVMHICFRQTTAALASFVFIASLTWFPCYILVSERSRSCSLMKSIHSLDTKYGTELGKGDLHEVLMKWGLKRLPIELIEEMPFLTGVVPISQQVKRRVELVILDVFKAHEEAKLIESKVRNLQSVCGFVWTRDICESVIDCVKLFLTQRPKNDDDDYKPLVLRKEFLTIK